MPATSSEISAKLGIDTKDIPADLSEARSFFKKFSGDIAADSAKAGDASGAKFAKGFSSQIAGQARGAIAAAIGLSAQGIADSLAGWLVGGTAKEWEEFGRIADENSKLIGERIRKNLSPAQLVGSLQKELEQAKSRVGAGPSGANAENGGQALSKMDALVISAKAYLGIGRKIVDTKIEEIKAQNEVIKIQAQLADAQKAAAGDETAFKKALRDYDFQIADNEEKRRTLVREIIDLDKELLSGTIKGKDVQDAKVKILQKDLEIRQLTAEITQKQADDEKKAADEKKKALEAEVKYQDKLLSLQKQKTGIEGKAADLNTQLADKSKLTIGELAGIDRNKFGVGVDVGNASTKAQEVQKLQEESERLRLSGDLSGSADKRSAANALTNELTNGGFLKSTENGDDAIVKQLQENHAEQIEVEKAIEKLLSGKFVNQ